MITILWSYNGVTWDIKSPYLSAKILIDILQRKYIYFFDKAHSPFKKKNKIYKAKSNVRGSVGENIFRLWNISQCCLFQSSRISLFTIATVMIRSRDKELKGYKKGNWFLPCDESTEPPRDHTSQSPTYALTTEAVKMASTYCGIPVTLIAFFLHTQADKHCSEIHPQSQERRFRHKHCK